MKMKIVIQQFKEIQMLNYAEGVFTQKTDNSNFEEKSTR